MGRIWPWSQLLSLSLPYQHSFSIYWLSDRLSPDSLRALSRVRVALFIWIETLSTFRRFLTIQLVLSFILSSCGSPSTPTPVSMTQTDSPFTPVPAKPAFETGLYPNLFKDYLGKS